ncbi:MAG: toll/interleukin-1 receptor domain-containing protein [Deltaproteobacteria bacterium]|nr:toll/interleukin-1 receptor domain-containing protein [Deltaproteobacteria bacterium]
MAVFISHITEEATVAKTLKDWIESTFLGKVKVFVSSDSDDIPAGDQWFDDVDKALDESQVMIILCSPVSITRPWINFEAGYAWIKHIPIIPVCHSGQDKGSLPVPLSRFQGLNIDEDAQILFKAINKHLELGITKFPRIDNEAFTKEISDALLKIAPAQAELVPAKKVSDKEQFEEIEINILKALIPADKETEEYEPFGSMPGFNADYLANVLNMHVTRVKYYLDKLEQNEFVNAHYSMMESTTYTLSNKGRGFLVENALI